METAGVQRAMWLADTAEPRGDCRDSAVEQASSELWNDAKRMHEICEDNCPPVEMFSRMIQYMNVTGDAAKAKAAIALADLFVAFVADKLETTILDDAEELVRSSGRGRMPW